MRRQPSGACGDFHNCENAFHNTLSNKLSLNGKVVEMPYQVRAP
jgi:hypothetical protein